MCFACGYLGWTGGWRWFAPLVGGGGHVGVLGWVIGDGFHRVGDMVVEHGGVFVGGIGVCPGCAKTVGDCCWRVPASRAACVVYRRDWGVGLFMLGDVALVVVNISGLCWLVLFARL